MVLKVVMAGFNDLVWLLLVMGGGDGDIWLSIMVDLVYGWCIGGMELYGGGGMRER